MLRAVLAGSALSAGVAAGIAPPPAAPAGAPLRHIVVIVKENHTFDNYFGQFPGADGARTVPIGGR